MVYCGTILNESQHSASHSAAYEAAEPQTNQSAFDDPCPPSKAPTMGTQASELDLGSVEEGRLVQ